MITFKKFGKTTKISNADWKRLRARFNPHNAIVKRGEYIIEKECPFCPRHNKVTRAGCPGCPLEVFGDSHIGLGCFDFFSRLFPDAKFETSNITDVTWNKASDIEARTQLHTLQEMMDKIEASQ